MYLTTKPFAFASKSRTKRAYLGAMPRKIAFFIEKNKFVRRLQNGVKCVFERYFHQYFPVTKNFSNELYLNCRIC